MSPPPPPFGAAGIGSPYPRPLLFAARRRHPVKERVSREVRGRRPALWQHYPLNLNPQVLGVEEGAGPERPHCEDSPADSQHSCSYPQHWPAPIFSVVLGRRVSVCGPHHCPARLKGEWECKGQPAFKAGSSRASGL